jgi:hypothetical protein
LVDVDLHDGVGWSDRRHHDRKIPVGPPLCPDLEADAEPEDCTVSAHRLVRRPPRSLTRAENVSGTNPRRIPYALPSWRQCERCGCSEGAIARFGWTACPAAPMSHVAKDRPCG